MERKRKKDNFLAIISNHTAKNNSLKGRVQSSEDKLLEIKKSKGTSKVFPTLILSSTSTIKTSQISTHEPERTKIGTISQSPTCEFVQEAIQIALNSGRYSVLECTDIGH